MKIPEYLNITNECNLELMKRYEDNHFNLAIVDPPYGININTNIGRRKGDRKSEYHKFAGNDNSIPTSEYFKELKRVSKNQIVFGGNYMTEHLDPSPCWLMWDKGFSEDVSFAQYEMAWTSFASSAKKFNYNAAKNKNRIHPTQKPVELYQWILTKYAKEGDKILDTHLGSGSIAIALDSVNKIEGMDLTLTACELDKEYFNKSLERISEKCDWLPMFQIEKETSIQTSIEI